MLKLCRLLTPFEIGQLRSQAPALVRKGIAKGWIRTAPSFDQNGEIGRIAPKGAARMAYKRSAGGERALMVGGKLANTPRLVGK